MEDLGPSTYFKQKNKYEPKKKNTIYKKLILEKTQMNCSVRNYLKFYFPDISFFYNNDINNEINKIENQNKTNYKSKEKTSGKFKKNNYELFIHNVENNNSIENNRKTFTKISHTLFNKTVKSKSFYGFPVVLEHMN